MKISALDFSGKYIALGEEFNCGCTVKMGSKEYIKTSTTAASSCYLKMAFSNEVNTGMWVNQPILNVSPVGFNPGAVEFPDNFSIATGGSKKFDAGVVRLPSAGDNANTCLRHCDSNGNTVPFDEGTTVGEALIAFSGDNGISRSYPVAVLVDIDGANDSYLARQDSAFHILLSRINPVVKSHTIEDIGEKNALGDLGYAVIGKSKIRCKFEVELDPADPTLTITEESLTVRCGAENRSLLYSHTTASTINGEFSWEFNQRHSTSTGKMEYWFRTPGTYTWTYTVTDSAGNDASISGSLIADSWETPTITIFEGERYTHSTDDEGHDIYPASDDGQNVRYTYGARIPSSIRAKNPWNVTIRRFDTSDTLYSLSGVGSRTIAQTVTNPKFASDTRPYSPLENIDVQMTVTDYYVTITKTITIPKAGGYLNVEKFGVAVGQRTTATTADKKFEVAPDYTTNLYGGISTVGGGDLCSASQLALGLQCGHVAALGSTASGSRKDATIDFETPFADGSVPIVLATFFSTSTAGNFGRCCVSVLDVSNQGFVLRFFNGDASARNPEFQWLAIGQVAAEGVPLAVRPSRPMTSNSSRNCVASASSTSSTSNPAWHAFDSNLSDYWASNKTDTAPWIQLQMPERLKNISIEVSSRVSASPKAPTSGSVLLSNDGSGFTRFASISGWNSSLSGGLLGTINCGNETGYSYIRLEFQNNTGEAICVGNITIRGEIDNS